MEGFPRVLVLSPTPTWPLDHGNRKRVHSVCEALCRQGAELDFLYYPAEHDWRRSIPTNVLEQMQRQWGTVFVVPPGRPLHTAAQDLDHTIDEWWDPAIGIYLDWLFSLKQYDALVVNYTWLSRALTHVPKGTFKVLDTHDRFSGRRELLARHGIGPEFFHTTDDQEAVAFARADLVLAIKSQEEDIFRAITATPVRTLPHMEVRREAPPAPPRPDRRYLSVGTIGANNSVNVTNLRRFLDVALPIFEKHMAPLRIVIAGGQCDGMGMRRHQPFVEVQGRVEDVDEFYESVDAVVVPLEFSTGLKIKVCEALARGVPVVSHEHAFEGYPPRHPAHRCASFEEMAMQLVRLAFNREELADLRNASVSAVRQTEQQFDATVRAIVRGAIVKRTTLVAAIPPGFANRYGYTHRGVMSVIRYLRYAARLVCYVPERSGIPDSLVEQELAPLGNVLREADDPGGLAELRRQVPVCAAVYWDLPSEAELEALGDTPLWMRCDGTDLRGQPLPEGRIVARLRGRRNVSVLDCADDRATRIAVRMGAVAEVVPFFYETPRLHATRRGAVVLCRDSQAGLARAVAGLLEAELPDGERVTVCASTGDGGEGAAGGAENGHAACHTDGEDGSGEPDAPVPLPALQRDIGRTPVGARVVVDLTGGDAAFATIRESLRRHRVPEVQLSASPGRQVARWDRPRSATELLGAIRTALSPVGTGQRGHMNDEGWARLWQSAERATNLAGL